MEFTVQDGKPLSEETKRKISNTLKGKIFSNETKQKISDAKKGKKRGPPSEEWRRKLSEANKGKKKPPRSKEHGRKISEAKRGKFQSKETKHKMRESRIAYMTSGKHNFKDTSIELKIEQELKKQNIPYLKQAPVEKIALVDFLLPNKIIIQCDGDFWHREFKRKNKDANQDFLLGFKGYRVFRFSETEINKSARKCILKIMKNLMQEEGIK